MNVNPYEAPQSGALARPPVKRRWLLWPFTSPLPGATIGAGLGATYGISYKLARLILGFDPTAFRPIDVLQATIDVGTSWGILGGGIGLLVAFVLWTLERTRHPR